MDYFRNYVLDNEGNAVPETDPLAWAKWFETADRTVARTVIGDVLVSTVFLGMDHGFRSPDPVLWETMIFGGEHGGEQWRYTSREAALAGHEAAVRFARGEGEEPADRTEP